MVGTALALGKGKRRWVWGPSEMKAIGLRSSPCTHLPPPSKQRFSKSTQRWGPHRYGMHTEVNWGVGCFLRLEAMVWAESPTHFHRLCLSLLSIYIAATPTERPPITFERYLWTFSGFPATCHYSPALSWVFAHLGWLSEEVFLERLTLDWLYLSNCNLGWC